MCRASNNVIDAALRPLFFHRREPRAAALKRWNSRQQWMLQNNVGTGRQRWPLCWQRYEKTTNASRRTKVATGIKSCLRTRLRQAAAPPLASAQAHPLDGVRAPFVYQVGSQWLAGHCRFPALSRGGSQARVCSLHLEADHRTRFSRCDAPASDPWRDRRRHPPTRPPPTRTEAQRQAPTAAAARSRPLRR